MSETKLLPPFKLNMPFKEALKRCSKVGKKDLDKQVKKPIKKFAVIIVFTFLLTGCGGVKSTKLENLTTCENIVANSKGYIGSESSYWAYMHRGEENEFKDCVVITSGGGLQWLFDN